MKSPRFASGTLAVVLSALPFLAPNPAAAQLFRNQPGRYDFDSQTQSRAVTLPAGVTIPMQFAEADTVYVTADETTPLTLTTAANVRDRSGNILIPAGSEVAGRLEPAGNGTQFVADDIVVNGRVLPLNGTSRIVTRTETIRRGAKITEIAGGVAAGAAAATLIAGVTGDNAIATEEVLGGAALGALSGWLAGRDRVEVLAVYPERDLAVTLQSELALVR